MTQEALFGIPVSSEIVVPQMGEGLREVTIIQFFKKPGEKIEKDEVLYEMETDKSLVEIEASVEGYLLSWEIKEGDTVAVGSVIGKIQTKGIPSKDTGVPCTKENIFSSHAENDSQIDMTEEKKKLFRKIPPRTRQYCKDANISFSEMLTIPFYGCNLLPTDVERYLEHQPKKDNNYFRDLNQNKETNNQTYQDVYLPTQQQILNTRFKSSQQNIIPSTLVCALELNKLEKAGQIFRKKDANSNILKAISLFQVFSYCVTQACIKFPLFRSMLINKAIRREFQHVNLGIAVQTCKGDLVTAVIPEADKLDFVNFIEALHTQVERALEGEDQIKMRPHIILSYMGDCGVLWGSPLLVDPAIALLFLGSPYSPEARYLHLSLTIDHRVINGIEAANFLKHIREVIEELSKLAPGP